MLCRSLKQSTMTESSVAFGRAFKSTGIGNNPLNLLYRRRLRDAKGRCFDHLGRTRCRIELHFYHEALHRTTPNAGNAVTFPFFDLHIHFRNLGYGRSRIEPLRDFDGPFAGCPPTTK
jgi:hypothetical protein